MTEPSSLPPVDMSAWRAGVSDAISALAPQFTPQLAERLLGALEKAEARDKPAATPAGPLFVEAHASGLAVANDPYATLINSISPGADDRRTQTSLGWAVLAQAAKTPLIAAIHKVILDQISEFCQPSDNPYAPGYMVRLRNRKQSGTPASARMCRKFETFLQNVGYVSDRRQLLVRAGLRDLSVACMRDSLTYDQFNAELIPTQALDVEAQRPGLLRWVDASTIRLSEQALSAYGLPDTDFSTPRYVQVIDGQPVAEFNPTQMIFGVRNATTSIYQCGYGISEIQMMASIITAWLNAFSRNAKYFEQGFGGRGFLVNKSEEAMSPLQMNNLKSDIQSFLTGVQGSHRVGILQSPMEFLTLGNEVQDRQWGDWSDLQVKLACSIYGVEPASINHVFGNQGQSSAMGTVRSAEREDSTRRRGLIPKVRWLFDLYDRSIIQQYDADFEVVPTGVDTDEAGALELDTKRLAYYTFNEVRAMRDLPPVKGGDVIGSTVGIQAAQMAQAEEAEPDEPAEVLDIGALFGGAEDASRSTAEVEDAGQAPRDDAEPLQASWRGATPGVRRLSIRL